MRDCEKNKQKMYYALFDSSTDDKDENGYYTGGKTITYKEPQLLKANISASKGETEVALFGNDVDYDRVISITGDKHPIDENTVFCVDVEPTYDTDNQLVYDYIVSRIAKSLNSRLIAIKKVKV